MPPGSAPPTTAPATEVGVATLVTVGLIVLVEVVVANACCGLATKPGGGEGSEDV